MTPVPCSRCQQVPGVVRVQLGFSVHCCKWWHRAEATEAAAIEAYNATMQQYSDLLPTDDEIEEIRQISARMDAERARKISERMAQPDHPTEREATLDVARTEKGLR